MIALARTQDLAHLSICFLVSSRFSAFFCLLVGGGSRGDRGGGGPWYMSRWWLWSGWSAAGCPSDSSTSSGRRKRRRLSVRQAIDVAVALRCVAMVIEGEQFEFHLWPVSYHLLVEQISRQHRVDVFSAHCTGIDGSTVRSKHRFIKSGNFDQSNNYTSNRRNFSTS